VNTSNVDIAIIGGGISGLTALHYVRSRRPDLSVRLFEAEDRLGGTLGTDRVAGFSFDWGPNGFLDREPLTLKLCDELGLTPELERANENVSRRFILRGGRLREVPMSAGRFLRSDILSLWGKLRLLTEPLRGISRDDDESIYAFVRRRIGPEAADYLVQPMVSGIFGGLADQLSLQSCFPIMREMEQKHGSLFKAMLAKAREAKRSGKRAGGPSGPGGWLTSFHGGVDRLTERLGERYRENIQVGSPVNSLRRAEPDMYRLDFGDHTVQTARAVIVAVPSYAAASILAPLSAPLAEVVSEIPYAPIAVVCTGFARQSVQHDLNGFGFVAPRVEGPRILGSIWTSSIFSDRAPADFVQFRTMIGGDGDSAVVQMSERELIDLTLKELSPILRLSGAPTVTRVYRWSRGIPQYKIGHHRCMSRMTEILQSYPGVQLIGNAYSGVGLNDCVKRADRAVTALSEKLPVLGAFDMKS
jgi:oxygen-dependent protoporphyrinogen oxidase